jgi:hypothetical protein
MPRAIINQKPFKDRFVEELRTGATPAKAARAAGISRSLAYEWREEDLTFDRAWADAVAEGVDKLEDEAFRRAHDGYSSSKRYDKEGRLIRSAGAPGTARVADAGSRRGLQAC